MALKQYLLAFEIGLNGALPISGQWAGLHSKTADGQGLQSRILFPLR